MKIVGLTGGIACGKSIIGSIFEELGANLIDADAIARNLLKPGSPSYKEVIEYFGKGILSPDMKIDRHTLGNIVFSDPIKKKRLEEILHPRIGKEIMETIEQLRDKGNKPVIIEAALFFETGMDFFVRPVIVVISSREEQIRRLMKRDGLSEEEAKMRVSAQMPIEDKIKRADFVIDNSGSIESTRAKARDIWRLLRDEDIKP